MKHKINKELVVLVGPMGAGKTTIGKMLAKELGYEFYDSDKEIERRSGANIPWIFDVEGESGFREREQAVVQELSMLKGAVLATGGGAMMRKENRVNVSRNGYIVYLNTSVEQQYRRTQKDRNRPLLQQSNDALKTLRELFGKRDPIYREVADLVISTDRKSIKTVVKMIVSALVQSDPLNN